jgi:glycerol-3-phosphate dehydrogenase
VQNTFDITVIGAGIHGAAIAREAVLHGYTVLVLEQFPAAALGTSSKSSKLIHGGLRYLESAQFRLVRECLAERRRLLAEQPGLVALQTFYIPVYRQTRRSPWTIAAGLALYTMLGGGGFWYQRKKHWPNPDGLNTASLRTLFRYQDAQTDDQRLTECVLQQAAAGGADIRYNAQFASARFDRSGCSIQFRQQQTLHHTGSRVLINATGPWVNATLQRVSPQPAALAIELVQGTHIIVSGALQQGIYYLESPRDQRAIFVMPWQGKILIGTTETPYQGDPGEVRPLECEIDYLLDAWNHYFHRQLQRSDVIGSFAGLRVLPASERTAFSRPRDTRLLCDPDHPQLISIYGGKLTTHRHTAEQVLQRVKRLLK